jgi:hypothetical protein
MSPGISDSLAPIAERAKRGPGALSRLHAGDFQALQVYRPKQKIGFHINN